MNIWQSIVLGIVQGISEFLPISSSGHLVLFQNFLEIYPPPIYFDLFLHLVSVVVIIYYFRAALVQINRERLINLLIATLPLLLIGFLLQGAIEPLFSSNLVAGIGLLATAIFNFVAAHRFNQKTDQQNLSKKAAGTIGLVQAAAIIPGISRSGSTLFGASLNNIKKEEAFEFSFLLGIFAILTATAGQLLFLGTGDVVLTSNVHWGSYLAGGAVCFITSLISLKLLKLTLKKTGYYYFGWYCLLIGAVSIYLHFH